MSFVSKTAIALLAIAAALLVLPLSGCGDRDADNLVRVDFPEKLNHRVSLRPSDSNESFRFAYVTDDDKKVVEEVEYKNGVTTYVFYRTDQTAEKILEFYPPDDPDPDHPSVQTQVERRMKSEVFLAADGKSYLRHTAFTLDGSVVRRGLRNPDGSYITHYLRAGTGSVEVEVLYDKDQNLQYETAYHENGVIKSRKERRSSYEIVTITYRDDGSKLLELTDSYYSRSGTFFKEDGVTPAVKFNETSYGSVTFEYLDAEGKLAHSVEYESDGDRTYTVFTGGDKASYRQRWKYVSGDKRCDANSTYRLLEVEEFHKVPQYGRYNWNDVTDVELQEDGVTPKTITVKEKGDRRLVVDYHPDGSVSRLVEFDAQGKELRTTTFRPGEKASPVTVKPSLLRFEATECLSIPAKAEVGTPPPMYYGDWGP